MLAILIFDQVFFHFWRRERSKQHAAAWAAWASFDSNAKRTSSHTFFELFSVTNDDHKKHKYLGYGAIAIPPKKFR